MKKLIYVEVTDDDIKAGQPYVPSLCPVARAVSRSLHASIMVGTHSIHDGRRTVGWLPGVAEDFIRRFDNGDRVEPFEFIFTLETP